MYGEEVIVFPGDKSTFTIRFGLLNGRTLGLFDKVLRWHIGIHRHGGSMCEGGCGAHNCQERRDDGVARLMVFAQTKDRQRGQRLMD